MGKNLVQKIIDAHQAGGSLVPGEEVAVSVDSILMPDSSGTMACLQFEAMGMPKVKTKLAVIYADHQTMQDGFENADDHAYLQSAADKFGLVFSKAGNGICHQVQLERYSRPGWIQLGADSHTPTCGAVGMISIGVGGLDLAVAMGGGPFNFVYPKVIRVNLNGRLKPWCSAKDVVLEVLRLFGVKGNVGCVIEYGGTGLPFLTVPERGTITNMGTETGVTTSIFPSDEQTKAFFAAQGRESDWQPLGPDPDATYDRVIDIDLDSLEPAAAMPHSPGNVGKIKDLAGKTVHQVLIGSCTNSSYRDLMIVAKMLEGRTVHPQVSLGIVPGSRQVYQMIAANGALATFLNAGARMLESACGFCFGSGQAPRSGAVSLRTSNRNFKGRSGTADANVYLVSPETAAIAAITGVITDPRDMEKLYSMPYQSIGLPEKYILDDSMLIKPTGTAEIVRGPNIGQPPKKDPLPQKLDGAVAIKVEDNITTDHILPASGGLMKYRSNVAKYSEYVLRDVDKDFPARCKAYQAKGTPSIIVAGHSYGQGSSREHAAICPMFLGVAAIIAKGIERIHCANLVNFGILPLFFTSDADYDAISPGDELVIENLHQAIEKPQVTVTNKTKGTTFSARCELSERQREVLRLGGLLNYTRQKAS